MKNIELFIKNFGWIIVIFLSIPLILPFAHEGYFSTHDGEWAVVRAAEMFREVRDFQFPPRYSGVLNFGYGYPLFNFTYPLPYYITTILHAFRFGFVDSVKILFSGSIIISSVGMYFLSSKIWSSKFAAILSALLYIYFPYRIVDLYVRGSLGESVAFMIVPWVMYFLILFIQYKINIFLVASGLAIGLLLLSHNIMALYFLPIIIICTYLHGRQLKQKAALPLFYSVLLGVSFSAFFILPAFFEKNYITLSKVPIADRNLYFSTLEQLVIPKWGYGTPTDEDGFSYQLGLGYIFILACTAWYVFRSFISQKKTKKNNLLTFLVGVSSLMILFMFSFTSIVWKTLPLLSEINYPWTLLGPLGFVLSLTSGFLYSQIKFGKYLVLAATILAIVVVFPNAHPREYVNRGDDFYLTNEATTTSSDELMPLWVREKPVSRYKDKVEVIQGNSKVINLNANSKALSFQTAFHPHGKDNQVILRINTIYYPGWRAYNKGKEFPISTHEDLGVIELFPKSTEESFELKFTETPLRLFSDVISLTAIIVMIIFLIFPKKKIIY